MPGVPGLRRDVRVARRPPRPRRGPFTVERVPFGRHASCWSDGGARLMSHRGSTPADRRHRPQPPHAVNDAAVAARSGSCAPARVLTQAVGERSARSHGRVDGRRPSPGGVVDRVDARDDRPGAHGEQARHESEASSAPIGGAPPESHADSTTERGGRRSLSRSWTMRGPSASMSDENSGASARKSPWAATWASRAPSSAARVASTVAPPPPSTTASRWRRRRSATLRCSELRPGPVTRATWPRGDRGGGSSRDRAHRAIEGETVRAASRSAGISAKGTVSNEAAGTMSTDGRHQACRMSRAGRPGVVARQPTRPRRAHSGPAQGEAGVRRLALDRRGIAEPSQAGPSVGHGDRDE